MRSRQQTDNRYRYNTLVMVLRRRYPENSVIPLTAVRHLMEELDYLRMGDVRTQNKFLKWLYDDRIMGGSVLELVRANDVMVLPNIQIEIEYACEVAELVCV